MCVPYCRQSLGTPVINSNWLYTENWGPNDAGSSVGYYLAIGASVSDSAGTLPNINMGSIALDLEDVTVTENRSSAFARFTAPVPEPSTMVLLASGLAELLGSEGDSGRVE